MLEHGGVRILSRINPFVSQTSTLSCVRSYHAGAFQSCSSSSQPDPAPPPPLIPVISEVVPHLRRVMAREAEAKDAYSE